MHPTMKNGEVFLYRGIDHLQNRATAPFPSAGQHSVVGEETDYRRGGRGLGSRKGVFRGELFEIKKEKSDWGPRLRFAQNGLEIFRVNPGKTSRVTKK